MKFLVTVSTFALVVCLTFGWSPPGLPPVVTEDCICSRKLELGIVLDSSSSISRDDFSEGRKFLQEYLRKFNIGQDKTRVSIITYDRIVHPEDSFNLTTYDSTEDVVQAIGAIPHRAGDYTNTWAGIRFMRERQLGSRYVRRGVPRVAIVLTDGKSQEGDVTAEEARKAREQGINIIAIGIGQDVDDQELLNIAGRSDHVDRVFSYGKLVTIVDWLAKESCVGED